MNHSKIIFAAIEPSFMPTLLEMLITLRDQGPLLRFRDGICGQLDLLSGTLDCSAWEHFSGDNLFPVPSQNKKQTHEDAFKNNDLWTKRTAYGRLRWKLLDWLIEQAQMWTEDKPKGAVYVDKHVTVFEDADFLPVDNAYRKINVKEALLREETRLLGLLEDTTLLYPVHTSFPWLLDLHNINWSKAPHSGGKRNRPFLHRKLNRKINLRDNRQVDTLNWLIGELGKQIAILNLRSIESSN
ncbi:hypothetical protein [Delftia phage PhiW-14]|uniref:Uncharacterized protein n=1 Tax=Delftia phage PhiW-14 TaxID=665032 RepID=C9DG72_BPW14|nr:hypothetical protein DP-phiW-14_gp102 [Delftia phage PhiW-14]ACV50123.1 hypothetical protein [Delftia phage PhiW-14]